MENNEVNSVVTQQPTGSDEPAKQESPVSRPTVKNGFKGRKSVKQPTDRTFTRDEVTQILKKRIDRYQNSVYNKYGVKDSAELSSLIDKAKQYDDIIKARDEALEKVAFLGNNINPDRYDDIRTYFKGKGLPFSEDSLKEQLGTHPEWLNKSESFSKPKTTITTVGTPSNGPVNRSEQDLAKKIFGEDLFN